MTLEDALAELAREVARRDFLKYQGNFLGWGFNSAAEMDAEGPEAAGVAAYTRAHNPYFERKLAFVRYTECGGDRERTEALAIDRAIAALTAEAAASGE